MRHPRGGNLPATHFAGSNSRNSVRLRSPTPLLEQSSRAVAPGSSTAHRPAHARVTRLATELAFWAHPDEASRPTAPGTPDSGCPLGWESTLGVLSNVR